MTLTPPLTLGLPGPLLAIFVDSLTQQDTFILFVVDPLDAVPSSHPILSVLHTAACIRGFRNSIPSYADLLRLHMQSIKLRASVRDRTRSSSSLLTLGCWYPILYAVPHNCGFRKPTNSYSRFVQLNVQNLEVCMSVHNRIRLSLLPFTPRCSPTQHFLSYTPLHNFAALVMFCRFTLAYYG
jgi:hypothetical protein